MLHLLKEKAKVEWTAKTGKPYEPLKPGIKIQKVEKQQNEQIDSSSQQFKTNIQNIAKQAAANAKK